MTATAHAIIGTVIAAKIGNPALAIPIAIASHIAADIFPHWDSGTNGASKSKKRLFFEASFDVILGFAISYTIIQLLFPQVDLLYAFIIIIASQSLDWITAPYYIFGIKRQPFLSLYKFQKKYNTKMDKPWGIIYQVAALILVVALGMLL